MKNQHSNVPSAEELEPHLKEFRKRDLSYAKMSERLLNVHGWEIS